jgi:predicted phosphodiesterase
MINPFIEKNMITDISNFYGRERELSRIVTRAGLGHSCSIVGEHKIGKSSILSILSDQRCSGKFGLDPEKTKFVYFSFQEALDFASPIQFWKQILELLAIQLPSELCEKVNSLIEQQALSFSQINYLIKRLNKDNFRFILLIDEFDAFPQTQLYNQSFIGSLYSLIDSKSVSFVFSSRATLFDLVDKLYQGTVNISRIDTACEQISVGLLSREDAVNLILQSNNPLEPSLLEEADFILEYAGTHPFLLQRLCCRVFETKKDRLLDKDDLIEISQACFYEDLSNFFETLWRSISNPNQAFIQSLISDNQISLPESVIQEVLRRGFIIKTGHGYKLFSRYFESYVQSQRMSIGVNMQKQLVESEVESNTIGRTLKDPSESTQVTKAVSWIHLSDFHFDVFEQYNRDIVINALLQDIEQQTRAQGLMLDFVVISGDVANHGWVEEYQLAGVFFDKLLSICQISKKQLFVIPGNHDVNRKDISVLASAAAQGMNSRDIINRILSHPADRTLLTARLKNYSDFYSSYFGRPESSNADLFQVHRVDTPSYTVAILALNSSWLCASDADQLHLALGEWQVRSALNDANSADLIIAMLHHPLDWLMEFDKNDAQGLLQNKCHFILHGHLHQPGILLQTTPDSQAMMIAAGSCYSSRMYPNSYNLVRYDPQVNQGKIFVRRYSDNQGGFWTKNVETYRNVVDGTYSFTLPANILSKPLQAKKEQ